MTSSGVDSQLISLDDLPSMPAASVRIVGLCDNAEVQVGELAEAISMDPALSARILRMANSAAFNRGNEVRTIERSMMLMGIRAVKLTALGFVVGSSLSDCLKASPEVMRQVWRECLVEAVACRELAELAHLRTTPEAFLSGMFDGMGKLLGLVARPNDYAGLIESDPWPTVGAERECLGMTRSELVQAALSSWGVPALYPSVLAGSDDPTGTFEDNEIGRLAAVLVLARQATRLLTGHGAGGIDAGSAWAALGLQSDAVDVIAVNLGAHVTDLANALDVDLGAEVDYPKLLDQARSRLVETSILMAQESIQQNDQISSLESETAVLRHEATTDRLTGLPNRASFDDELSRRVADRLEGRTTMGAVAIAMIDIDNFKRLNDTYGHGTGDDVLVAVGSALAKITRSGEMIARYGGEEFAVVMPVVDNAVALRSAVERIRTELAEVEIRSAGLVLHITVSIGAVAAQRLSSVEGGIALTAAADRLLYQAKNEGRDCTRIQFLAAGSNYGTDPSTDQPLPA